MKCSSSKFLRWSLDTEVLKVEAWIWKLNELMCDYYLWLKSNFTKIFIILICSKKVVEAMAFVNILHITSRNIKDTIDIKFQEVMSFLLF